MANIKNLTRLGQIADALPRLEKARSILSGPDGTISVTLFDMENLKTESVELPPEMRLHVVQAINVEINKLKEEIKQL